MDRDEPVTSSKVAAGIVNPITGPRLAKTWRFDEFWPVAVEFYRQHAAGAFHQRSILRLLIDDGQVARWKSRMADPAYAKTWKSGPTRVNPANFRPQPGAFETQAGGWLDVAKFLQTSRREFQDRGCFRVGDGVPSDVSARKIVWCQGYQATESGPFTWAPIRPGKGQILDLTAPNLDESRIVNWGKWLLPQGGGVFRAGATFERDAAHGDPDPSAREEIETALAATFLPPFEVTAHRAAFRPMGPKEAVILGLHPKAANHAIFNGLGAKGVLLAPFFARQLLDHLERGQPLDAEMDVRRFWAG